MKHPGHTYGGFIPPISERGMTGLCGRISAGVAGVGEDGGGACLIMGGRCQRVTEHRWWPHEWGGASA
jgi:hypothetical protein